MKSIESNESNGKLLKKQVEKLELRFPVAEISKKTGHGKGNVSEYINQKKEPSRTFLLDFCRAYNIDKGIFFKKDLIDQELLENNISTISTPEGEMNGIITRNTGIQRSGVVEYYDVDFSAGEGAVTMLESHRPTYNMDIPGFGGCVAFNVYGDSMESRLRSGSIVFGRKIEAWREHLEYGQVYGIVMKDERRYLKYIRKAPNSKAEFLLRSENPKYDDFEIPKKSIHNIWLIEGWMLKTA